MFLFTAGILLDPYAVRTLLVPADSPLRALLVLLRRSWYYIHLGEAVQIKVYKVRQIWRHVHRGD